jgi:hypothetical protein
MNLDQQIQALIADAPQDGTTPALVEAIAPILKQLAAQLRHLQYYIVQTLDQDWAVTTLGNKSTPESEKNVIYAYPTLKDVSLSPYPIQDPQMIAIPLPVIQILFQMLALEGVNSTIFFESPGDVSTGTEIRREDLTTLIQSYISQLQPASNSNLPPDIA